MKILGIETSCDETSCSVVENGSKVLSNVIASQIDLHTLTGGVVPEVAAREHVLKIIPVLDEAMKKAGCGWKDIDAVAIVRGPGLVSSLIIGTETANIISYVKKKKLIPVQHIIGHIYANWLERDNKIKFPVLVLTVSGGHNELILMRDYCKFKVLGETRDDAAGEAFDKVARILGLGYPGGPVIAKAALKGNSKAFKLPRTYLEEGTLDFSFSGLKTAVLNEVKKVLKIPHNSKSTAKIELKESFKADLAASFQDAVVDILSEKLIMALKKYPEVKEVHLAGGVSANTSLREVVEKKLPKNITFRFPNKISYCTDNAAMIGAAGYYLYKSDPKKYKSETNIIPTTSFEIK